MEEILSDIGSTPSLEPVTDDNLLDLFNAAAAGTASSSTHPHAHPHSMPPPPPPPQHQNAEEQSMEEHHHSQDMAYDDGTTPTGTIATTHQQQQEAEAEERRKAKIHSCGFCGAVYPSYRELVEHRASHGGSRPYECHMCDKRFTQKAHLIIHRRTHTGEKPYSCHICHKRFSQTSHLNSHKRVHTGEKPYFCSICHMGFCRRQRLEVHLQQHAKDMQHTFTGQPGHDLLQHSLGSAHSSLQQNHQNQQQQQQQNHQQAVFSSGAAKDFLVSIGLGSVMEEAGESGMDRGGDHSSSSCVPKGVPSSLSSQSQMAVFPGFSMEGEETESRDAAEENDHPEGEDSRLSGSPTATSSSHGHPTPSSKNRRKPAFVRKLGGGGQAEKEDGREQDSVVSGNKDHDEDDDNDNDTGRTDLSAHTAAAVRAMMCMATGSDYANTEDLTNDLLALGGGDNNNGINSVLRPSSFPGAGAATPHQDRSRNHSPKGYPPDNSPHHHGKSFPASAGRLPLLPSPLSSLIRTNSRVSLVDFTADDLMRHLMSRDDVFRCDFCKVVFQDAAMYHLHRSMHDKRDVRCCNLCGRLLVDKYDFTVHFLSQHK